MARTPSRKEELNSNCLTAGTKCGSVLRSRLWGGVLRDDTKNDCVADYNNIQFTFNLIKSVFATIIIFLPFPQ